MWGGVTSLQVRCKTERDRELMPTIRECDGGWGGGRELGWWA